MPDINTEKTFYQQRMELLGVTEENNLFKIKDPLAEFPAPSSYDIKIFAERQGNIEIMFWTLDREMISYIETSDAKMGDVNGKPRHYMQTRLAEPQGDRKYILPKSKWLIAEGMDATYPWMPPEIVEAWENKEKIPVLALTEGAFKAWMASKCQIPTIGLTSITHYADRNGKLHRDIQRIIVDCAVEKVVIIWDGDCLDISENALARREDLVKRPLGFYAAAKKIRHLVADIEFPDDREKPAVYFYHIIKEAYKDKPKGLDDLLICGRENGDLPAIAKHAADSNTASPYFKKFDLTDTTKTLYEYFCLKDAEKFYARHAHIIKGQEFKFDGDLMRYNLEKEELILVAPKFANNLRWIGDDFYMIVDIPTARKGETRKELKAFKQTTLEKLFRPKFWKYLEHFNAFCNVPSHFEYKQVQEFGGKMFYNRYFPFPHRPEKGSWEHIKRLITHIFGEEELTHPVTGSKIKRWEVAIDYIRLLLLQPVQDLPILILYSPENNTGKSTFCNLLGAIFGDNMIRVSNSDLQSDFNEPYADKLLIVCEETMLDRKKDSERFKNFSTSERIQVNPKGVKQYSIDFFGKFIFCSNNARMIYLTRHDDRYWIIKVPPVKTGKDPELMAKMKAEIPAFIHYLKEQPMFTAKEDRMHFHTGLLKTDALEDTIRVNEPSAVSDMREELANMFIHEPDIKSIEMPLKEIRETFFQKSTSTGWLKEILRDYLQADQLKDLSGRAKVKRGAFPLWEKNTDGSMCKKMVEWIGRPYVFKREDYLKDENPEDYKEIEDAERQSMAALMGNTNGGRVADTPLTVVPKEDLPF